MPAISMWLTRCALASLAVGWTIGSLMLASRGAALAGWSWMLRPLHVELLLFGWMVQFAFGVASWILPRTPRRSSSQPLVVTLVLLNVGVWTAGLGAIGNHAIAATTGRILEVAAIVVFAWYIWPRVRAFRD